MSSRGRQSGAAVTMTGHSGGGVGRGYGGGFGLKALAEAMGSIEVPEAVKGLAWAQVS